MRFSLSILLFSLFELAFAQLDSIGTIEDNEYSNVDFLIYSDVLEERKRSPLNLNDCSDLALYNAGLFNLDQVKAIVDFRNKFGGFYEVGELKSLQGFNVDEVDRITPYITVSAIEQTGFNHSKSSFLSRFSTNNSPRQDDLGPHYHFLSRWKYRGDQVSLGLVYEKDYGELLYTQTGLSYLAWYGEVAFNSMVDRLVLGDYNLYFGEGLLFGSAYNFGKSYNSTSIGGFNKSLFGHASSNEFFKLRGGAIHSTFLKSSLVVFASFQNRSASINQDSTFGALKVDGLFTSENDEFKRNVVGESIAGIHYQYSGNRFLIGATGVFMKYSDQLNKRYTHASAFDFREEQLFAASIDFKRVGNKEYTSGEINFLRGDYSFIIKEFVDLGYDAELLLMLRRYSPSNDFVFSNAIAERSKPKNEEGVYLGFKKSLSQNLSWNTYIDMFRFPWVTIDNNGVSYGRELANMIMIYPGEKHEIQLRQKFESKNSNDGNQERSRYRVQMINELTKSVRFKTSVEYQHLSSLETGFLVGETIKVYLRKLGLSMTVGLILYRSDAFDSGIHLYESDVRYAFSIPKFYGEGERFYLVLRKKFSNRIVVYLKYGEHHKVDSPFKRDFRCQLNWDL